MKRTFSIMVCIMLALAGCAQAPATYTPENTQTTTPMVAPTLETTESPTAIPDDDTDYTVDVDMGTQSPDDPAPTATYVNDGLKSVTTGLDKKAAYKPVGVMIENTVAARPQKGMGQADIVYEVLVENASMTRFLCVFNDNMPKNVGPVRSTRPYYIDLMDEYAGVFCFFGGPEYSPSSIYTRFEKSPLKVVANGLKGAWGKYYWRSKEKAAPHNVYTDLTRFTALFDELPETHHFLFDAGATLNGEDVTKINIPYNKTTLKTDYVYDAASKKYKRLVNGKPFIDALDNMQISVSNVIVQNTKLVFTHDYKGRVDIEFIGNGTADVFSGGKHVKATWEKKSITDPTIYRDDKGQEITLQPGNTWVQVVYDKIKYTYGK